MKITVENILTSSGWRKDATIEFEGDTIAFIRAATEQEKLAMQPGYLVPGYIDTQVNGGGGVLLNQAPEYASVDAMAKAHMRFGTTGMLPTVITDNADVMARSADAVAAAIDQGNKAILGLHFEGPFLSCAKKGVHEETLIRLPTDAEMATITRRDLGKVMLTLAPEQVELGLIRELVSEGVLVSLGHTNATFEQVNQAIAAGATGFTHLYNAMSPLTSREPGVVGAALLADTAYCGLIVDHHHVHKDSARIAIKQKGSTKIMLVTDAMAHVGSDLSTLPFFATEIIRTGSKLTTPAGTLAGSCLDMHGAVVNTHRDLGIELADAVTMASHTPASFLGLESRVGTLAPGAQANAVLMNEDLSLRQVWLSGELTVEHSVS